MYEIVSQQEKTIGKETGIEYVVEFSSNGYKETQTYFGDLSVVEAANVHFEQATAGKSDEPFYFVPQEPNSEEAAAE